eukprot:3067229-Rhodomonas_salina.2
MRAGTAHAPQPKRLGPCDPVVLPPPLLHLAPPFAEHACAEPPHTCAGRTCETCAPENPAGTRAAW